MKLLFVSQENRIGGATRSLIELICGIKAIQSIPLEIDLLIPRARKIHRDAKRYAEASNISCIEVYYKGNFKNIHSGGGDRTLDLINYCSLLPIVHLIREKQYDMICSNSISVDVGARAAEIAKIPHIYYFREFMEEDFGIEFRNQKKMKRLIETSEIGIFISKAVQEKYRKLYSLKNSVQFFVQYT